MPESQSLEIEQLINAPLQQVYRSFTSSVALESWFSDFAEFVPSENGRFYVFWNAGHYAVGFVKKLVENQQISLSWHGRGESNETQVKIVFHEEDGQTRITIQHSGLGISGHWIESSKSIQSGWEFALENLKSVLETGLDKRAYDRPMLGIYPSQVVNHEIVQKHNLPVSTGIQIGGVVEGLGAEAAGLQENDVIFSLNLFQLKGFGDFAKAIADKNAGDPVEVVFYRGERKFTVQMELSRRPSPQVPDSAQELSALVAQSYDEFNDALDKTFDGVSEREASFCPGAEDWSAKETLVHLLYTERWLHLAISCVVSDQRTGGFINQLELIKAVADSYTLGELIAELKKCQEVTVNSLAALPVDFLTDKRRYINFASSFGQGFSKHSLGHLPQIQDAIFKSRGN
jgi:uncharacterized protein YndB with AHSA1/START domain